MQNCERCKSLYEVDEYPYGWAINLCAVCNRRFESQRL